MIAEKDDEEEARPQSDIGFVTRHKNLSNSEELKFFGIDADM